MNIIVKYLAMISKIINEGISQIRNIKIKKIVARQLIVPGRNQERSEIYMYSKVYHNHIACQKIVDLHLGS